MAQKFYALCLCIQWLTNFMHYAYAFNIYIYIYQVFDLLTKYERTTILNLHKSQIMNY